MNQSFVAGLGNIYCSEILFDAQINPKKFVKILTISRLGILYHQQEKF